MKTPARRLCQAVLSAVWTMLYWSSMSHVLVCAAFQDLVSIIHLPVVTSTLHLVFRHCASSYHLAFCHVGLQCRTPAKWYCTTHDLHWGRQHDPTRQKSSNSSNPPPPFSIRTFVLLRRRTFPAWEHPCVNSCLCCIFCSVLSRVRSCVVAST